MKPKYKTLTATIAEGKALGLERFPNFHKTGSILGMKQQYYGMSALLIRCGSYIYNVTSDPKIYWEKLPQLKLRRL